MIKKRSLGGICDGEDGARNGDDAFEGGFFALFFFNAFSVVVSSKFGW